MKSPRNSKSQSQRDCVSQPRVARNVLPWVNMRTEFQPQRGCIGFHRVAATPLGLRINVTPYPKVARSSQPWAECWNPLGIHSGGTHRQLLPRERSMCDYPPSPRPSPPRRGRNILRLGEVVSRRLPWRLEKMKTVRWLFPLPGGEGQGEGARQTLFSPSAIAAARLIVQPHV